MLTIVKIKRKEYTTTIVTTLQARTKSTTLRGTAGYLRLAALAGICLVLTVILFLLTRDVSPFPTLTIGISSMVMLGLAIIPAREMKIEIDSEQLVIDGQKIGLDKILFWSMVDLNESIELIFQVSNITGQFIYLYLDKEDQAVKNFLLILTNTLPYNEELIAQNPVHVLLRNLGFK